MDAYISRQPILNSRLLLGGYRLLLDPNTAISLLRSSSPDAGPAGTAAPGFLLRLSELSDGTMPFIDWFPGLPDMPLMSSGKDSDIPRVAVVVSANTALTAVDCAFIKKQGYLLAVDSALIEADAAFTELCDIVIVDFPMVSIAAQKELLRNLKNRARFLADRIETWEDLRVAKNMGYELFRGYFFLWPQPDQPQKDIRSLDACLVSIISELEMDEPSFKKISELIEHDLGLSYRLLRLVNSAYMAPKYKITSIAHALAYLGTRELHQWISVLLMGSLKSEQNSELVKMSLIRGKLMALITQELQLAGAGSGPFFTGLFSMIDAIFNKDMKELLSGLPLSDEVKSALNREANSLSRLLDFVVGYEQARWQNIEGRYPLDTISEEKLVSLYFQAHQWAMLID